MYYGYCFIAIDGQYTPKVRLPDAKSAYDYCMLQHVIFPEIRITDEDDFCVMHVVNHVLYVPFPYGTFRSLNFQTKEVRSLTKEQIEAEIEAQKVSK